MHDDALADILAVADRLEDVAVCRHATVRGLTADELRDLAAKLKEAVEILRRPKKRRCT